MTAGVSSSRIEVACPCGKTYRCRAALIGKRFKCRVCGASFEAKDCARQQPARTNNCPGCEDELNADADFCFSCGYDLETGQDLFKVSEPADSGTADGFDIADGDQNRTRKAIWKPANESSPAPEAPVNVGPWLPGFVALSVIAGFVILQSQLEISGRMFLAFYGLVLAVCWVYAEIQPQRAWKPLIVSAVTFIGIGMCRFVYGMTHDMHKFLLLFVMMAIGTAGILIGVKTIAKETAREITDYLIPLSFSAGLTVLCITWTFVGPGVLLFAIVILALFTGGGRRRRKGWHSSCSSCSSCGGGGCGGGGCGGCGGG